jgi:lipopolysaccharide/colanic/teichoic acid biosynthesis glycosyltransferase
MYVGSENGNKYTQENDARITRVGKILRKMRLDELAQLFNVMKGEMSLIGPRAEWTKCVEDYENIIPYYHLRHLVKPGITGWAQVFYSYGSSVQDAHEKLQYDLYYIKNYSLFLDIAIVFKTLRVVVFGKGV